MVDRMINAGTWSGAFISAFGALTINQWLAIGGFCLAAAGFLVNFWFKYSLLKIDRAKLNKNSDT